MTAKKKIVSGLAVLVLMSSIFSAAIPVYAASGPANSGNWFSVLVTFLSQKFGLDKTQVQSAMNEYHAQQMATIQRNMQDRQ